MLFFQILKMQVKYQECFNTWKNGRKKLERQQINNMDLDNNCQAAFRILLCLEKKDNCIRLQYEKTLSRVFFLTCWPLSSFATMLFLGSDPFFFLLLHVSSIFQRGCFAFDTYCFDLRVKMANINN